MRTLLVTAVALLLAVSFAEGKVDAVHDGGSPTVGLPGYTSYVVSLVSDTADMPVGYDSTSVVGGGFNGPMNQILAGGVVPTPTLTDADLIAPPYGETHQDSHFLVYEADIVVGAPLNETGTYLGGAFGLTAGFSNPMPLALLVIQDGNSVQLTGTAADEAHLVEWPLDLTVPEPLTLTLLGVGGLALIRRRR